MPHQAVAKELTLNLHPPLAVQGFRPVMMELMQKLGQNLSVKGVIPGHIKALVVENDVFAAFSCTRPGKIMESASPGWDDFLLSNPRIYLNVVLVEISQEKVNGIVNRCLEEMLQNRQISGKP